MITSASDIERRMRQQVDEFKLYLEKENERLYGDATHRLDALRFALRAHGLTAPEINQLETSFPRVTEAKQA